ncbi:FixH family protein [Parendozoicomonas haliclonae]|uniref:FixH n=1 Tax=Parendozoicomonas haliclonae TaxID=1960125 RepID=A0A1X7AI98_9GAMM|nr:FixH family protein [Parendozoicomonas haliclonae]SMA43570.1 FixH [Parendozoicomonas haliclonae]
MTQTSPQQAKHHTKNGPNGEPFTRWYQEPWTWVIIGIIVVSVIRGLYQVYISVINADEVVVDDYYKVGKAINQDLSRDRRAAEAGLEAVITLRNGNSLIVEMSGVQQEWPRQLRLKLIPAIKGQEKQEVALLQAPHSPMTYSGQIQQMPEGRFYVQLETLDQLTPEVGYLSGWRINREALFEPNTPVTLSTVQ